jgi:hypothetical protein
VSGLVATSAPSRDRHPIWPSVLMFAYGAGWSFTVKFVGYVYVAELVAILALPFVGVLGALRRYALLRLVLFAYALILAGLIVADVANQTPSEMVLRGWANPIFAAISMMFVVASLDRYPKAIFGFFLGLILFTLVFGSAGYQLSARGSDFTLSNAMENPNGFKIRYVPFLLPLLAISIHYIQSKSRVLAATFALAAAGLFLFLGARSAGIVSAVLAIASAFIRPIRKIAVGRIMMIAASGAIIGYLGYAAFVTYSLQSSGHNNTTQQLARIENPYNPFELLGVGRSDWLTSSAIISERPFFGYGSWAYDMDGRYTFLRASLANDLRSYNYEYARELQLIPVHSVLLTSWIWGGLIGFCGAICLAGAICRSIMGVFRPGNPLMIVGMFCVASLIWDFLFSPFQTIRSSFPQYLGFLIVIYSAFSSALGFEKSTQVRR